MSTRQRLGLAGAVAGALVAGVGTGLVAERKTVRAARDRVAPADRQRFEPPQPDRSYSVSASDGVRLHVEETGPTEAPLTIVLVHGYTLSLQCWWFQRRDLADLGRLVLFDQRSHGRSGHSTAKNCTIDQLADDLGRVLDAARPPGPVVLVAHSMGGMAALALAHSQPHRFAPSGPVIGAGLLSTSAGRLASVTLGLPAIFGTALAKLRPGVWVGLGRRTGLVELGRKRGTGSDIAYALTRRFSFGDPSVDPGLVDFMESMINATSVEVMTAFAPALLVHDQTEAVPTLRPLENLVLVGDHDLLTPVDHAQALADALPDAELVVLADAGHMAILERAPEVSAALRRLVQRALAR